MTEQHQVGEHQPVDRHPPPHVSGPGSRPPTRASHAERTAAAHRLEVALEEGRLDVSEFDERVRAAYAAATRDQLSELTADLPALSEEPSVRRRADRWRAAKQWRDWAATSVVLVGIWALISFLSGGLTAFWPIVPVIIWGMILVVGAVFDFGEDGDRRPDDIVH